MPRTPFYSVITPGEREWEMIEQLQEVGKLPIFLRQVFIYRNSRQYERNVLELEHWKVVEVKLQTFNPYSISPRYSETVKHDTCYNPFEGRLHVFLAEYESLGDLEKKNIFIPPIYSSKR